MTVKDFTRKAINKLRKKASARHLDRVRNEMRARLKNKDFTLITNNCIGGIIYHDLGLKFNSPTVNLAIPMPDYMSFLKNPDKYINAEIIDCGYVYKGERRPYPIAKIDDMYIWCIHYKSFDEFKEKWNERKTRINKENLFVIGQYIDECTDELASEFFKLPYKNKIFITSGNFDDPCVVKIKTSSFLYGKNRVPGADVFSDMKGTRFFYKDFDFVRWFNGELQTDNE